MGFGDVKLAAVMGLYLGWLGWTDRAAGGRPAPARVLRADARAACSAWCSGSRVQIATKRRGAFPFGPALALGCYVVVLFADRARPPVN